MGWEDANSTEFNPSSAHRVIDWMPDQTYEGPKGRNHAAGSLSGVKSCPTPGWRWPTASRKSKSGTGIDLNSAMNTGTPWRKRDCALRGHRRMDGSWRLWSCRSRISSWAFNITRNSRAVPTAPTRSFGSLSRRRSDSRKGVKHNADKCTLFTA